MNIFVTDPDPVKSAQVLPDKHIVKMPLETCQMLSIVASKKWGHGFGTLPKLDGTPYKTDKGAFRNHPCTIWAQTNFYWLIEHGLSCPPPTSFVFAGFDQFKYDTSIDIFTKYKRYIASKPWVATNYLRDPSRKPEWV